MSIVNPPIIPSFSLAPCTIYPRFIALSFALSTFTLFFLPRPCLFHFCSAFFLSIEIILFHSLSLCTTMSRRLSLLLLFVFLVVYVFTLVFLFSLCIFTLALFSLFSSIFSHNLVVFLLDRLNWYYDILLMQNVFIFVQIFSILF